ncbi:unnamed protein product, partial [Allacma fusca]
RLKTLERNCVAKIQRKNGPENWFHIPGAVNPADLPSRGVSANELSSSSIWFNEPTYLLRPEINPMPTSITTNSFPDAVEPHFEVPSGDVYTPATACPPHHIATEPTSRTTVMLTDLIKFPSIQQRIEQYSDWKKLLRHTSWWIRLWRFYTKQETFSNLHLTPIELNHASNRLVWALQETFFGKEKSAIRRKIPL